MTPENSPISGKGNEKGKKSVRTYRCRYGHRYAKVTLRVVKMPLKAGNPKRSSEGGISLVQVCRGCACFRISTFFMNPPDRLPGWKWTVKMFPSAEGTYELTLDPNHADYLPKERLESETGGVLI
jgi:hypothetical protein